MISSLNEFTLIRSFVPFKRRPFSINQGWFIRNRPHAQISPLERIEYGDTNTTLPEVCRFINDHTLEITGDSAKGLSIILDIPSGQIEYSSHGIIEGRLC